MKLRINKGLRAALAACFALAPCLATASADEQATPFAAPSMTNGGTGVTHTWNKDTQTWDVAPADRGIILFDNVGTVSTNPGVFTEHGGIKVIGEGSNVTASSGSWGGSICVGAGAALTTNTSNKWKNNELNDAANFYVEGTLTITDSSFLLHGSGYDHRWYIGADGVINLKNISALTKESNRKLNVDIITPDTSTLPYEEGTLTGRTIVNDVVYQRTYINSGITGVSSKIDTLRVFALGADGETHTLLTKATGDTASAGTYRIVDGADNTNLVIEYTGLGYEALDLIWSGDTGTWSDTGTTWHQQGSTEPVSFIAGDSVSFSNDNTGTNYETVTVSGTVAPKDMLVDGSFKFKSSNNGTIQATGSLTLADNANVYVDMKTSSSVWHDITLGDNSTLKLHAHTAATPLYYGALTLGNNAVYESEDGSYQYSSLKLTGTAATLNLHWNKTTRFGDLEAEDKTLNVTTYNKPNTNNDDQDTHTLEFTGEVNVGSINVSAGNSLNLYFKQDTSTTINYDGSGTLWIGGGSTTTNNNASISANALAVAHNSTLTLSGGTAEVDTLRLNDKGSGGATLTIKNGANVTVNGTVNDHGTGSSLLLSHWGGNSTLNLEGGSLTAEGAEMNLSWTGTGTFNATGGVATLLGIDFDAQSNAKKGTFTLGTDSSASNSVTVKIGASGIKHYEGNNTSITLGGGTLQATADWQTTSEDGKAISLSNTTNGTILDTQAHTVTLNNALGGAGKLIKQGDGKLLLNKASSTYTGKVEIEKGQLVAGADGALGSGNVEVKRGGALVVESTARTISNDITLGTAATISGSETTSYKDVVISDSGINGTITSTTVDGNVNTTQNIGEISDATLELTGTYTLSNVVLNDTSINVNSGATLTMSGTINGSASISVDGGVLSASDDSKVITGTLDLSDISLLTLANLTLAEGATVILGEDTRINLSGNLNVGENVIFDVSSWCSYNEFTPYELISYTGEGTFTYEIPEYVTIHTSTGDNAEAFLKVINGDKVMLVPEPTTATLSLLALAGLAARRRRK